MPMTRQRPMLRAAPPTSPKGNLFDDPNNLVIVRDQALALAYTLEFEEMWGGSGQPVPRQQPFREDKTDNTPPAPFPGGRHAGRELLPAPRTGTTHAISVNISWMPRRPPRTAPFILTENTLRDALLEAHADGSRCAVW